MEPSPNPIKTRIIDLYLQLSEVTARMESQTSGGVGGDYRLTYFEFRELMIQLYDLSHWLLREPYKPYKIWKGMRHRTDINFVNESAKMYERYVKRLVGDRIIDVKKDMI